MEEYDLREFREIDRQERERLLRRGRSRLRPADLAQFVDLDISRERLLPTLIERGTYPLLGVLALYALVSYLQGERMQAELKDLTARYQALKEQNAPLKKKIRDYNRQVRFLETFAGRELAGVDPLRLLYDLIGLIHPGEAARFTDLRVGANEIRLSIETREDPVTYLNRLNALGYLDNVVIRSTRKLRKSDKKVYTFLMDAVQKEERP
jgi:cell division protein FtsB